MIQLGNKVKCLVTGFEGIATSRVEYLNGCVQYCVVPAAVKNESADGKYIDVGQLKVVGKGISIESRRTGGPQSNTPSATYRG